MNGFSLRVLAAVAMTVGTASVARAADLPAVYGTGPTTPATVSEVASVTPANVAGLLNYCVETDLVSHEDGDALQAKVNAKTNAVPADQHGSLDYAIGTSGEFQISGKRTTLTVLGHDDQAKLCSAVLTRAQGL